MDFDTKSELKLTWRSCAKQAESSLVCAILGFCLVVQAIVLISLTFASLIVCSLIVLRNELSLSKQSYLTRRTVGNSLGNYMNQLLKQFTPIIPSLSSKSANGSIPTSDTPRHIIMQRMSLRQRKVRSASISTNQGEGREIELAKAQGFDCK